MPQKAHLRSWESSFRPSWFDRMSVPVFVMDRDAVFVYVNEAMAKLLARPVDELIGTKADSYVVGDESARALGDELKVFRGASLDRVVYNLFRPDGTVIRTITSAGPVTDRPGGKVTHIVGIVRESSTSNETLQVMDHVDGFTYKLGSWMETWGSRLLQWSLALVFLWFGALKVFGVSPVVDLVTAAVPWFAPEVFIPILGCWEIAIGLGLASGIWMRFTLLLFWLQMAGTFLVLLVRPDIAFQNGNPLLLSIEGEFVIKNLVLIAAGIVVGSTIRSQVKKK